MKLTTPWTERTIEGLPRPVQVPLVCAEFEIGKCTQLDAVSPPEPATVEIECSAEVEAAIRADARFTVL